MSFGSAPPKKPIIQSIVFDEQIWTDHVTRELENQLTIWPFKWGFLIEEYRKLNDQLKEMRKARLRIGKEVAPPKTTGELPPLKEETRQCLPYPNSTAHEIGWRSSRPECQLEKYKRLSWERSRKGSILRRLNWPIESMG